MIGQFTKLKRYQYTFFKKAKKGYLSGWGAQICVFCAQNVLCTVVCTAPYVYYVLNRLVCTAPYVYYVLNRLVCTAPYVYYVLNDLYVLLPM